MSIRLSVEEQEQLAETLRRGASGMPRGEIVAELLWLAGLAAAVLVIWWLDPPRGVDLGRGLACLLVFVVANRVELGTPFGYTVPTQLAFVPLLFSLPLAIVPLAAALGVTLARMPDLRRGAAPVSRLLVAPNNAWFAVGPVALFALAGVQPRHADPGLLVAALLAQFLVDALVSSLRLKTDRAVGLGAQLRDSWVYGVDAALSGVGLLAAEQTHSGALAVLALLPLLGVLAVFARERRERLSGLLELSSAYRGTALVLGDVVEADDGYTGEHCRSVVELALAVAERLKLGADRRRNLEFGALLHDVGKIAIPKEIINKPGKLDPHEWTIIKTHTVEGQKMLDRVGGFMREVGLIVRSHHERWDGAGYPDGLAARAIPLEARIISCCDTWNAMRTDRSYRRALDHEAAVAELQAHSGTQFDPQVVTALLEIVAPEAVAPEAVVPEAVVPEAAAQEAAAAVPVAGPVDSADRVQPQPAPARVLAA